MCRRSDPPPRLRQLNAGLAYTMASFWPLNGAIQPGVQRCRGGGCCRVATQPPQEPLVLTRVYAPATDQSPPAIAATESRPCINHGQPQAFKRRNSAGEQLCGGRECCQVATQPPQEPLVLARVYAPATDRSPPAIAATESRPCINHGQPQAFKRRISAAVQRCGGRGCVE